MAHCKTKTLVSWGTKIKDAIANERELLEMQGCAVYFHRKYMPGHWFSGEL